MKTSFAIVSDYQVEENYDGRWKMKGGREVTVLTSITEDEMSVMSEDTIQGFVARARPEDNDMYRYSDERYEVVTLDRDLIVRVNAHIVSMKNEHDLGYIMYRWDGTDYAFTWACRQLPAMLARFADDETSTNWNTVQNILSD